MHEQGQALTSPLQQSLHRQSASSSPKQSPLQSEQPSFGVGDAYQVEQGSFAALIEEATDATHQVQLAFFSQSLQLGPHKSAGTRNSLSQTIFAYPLI